jgi:hypothetical protein
VAIFCKGLAKPRCSRTLAHICITHKRLQRTTLHRYWLCHRLWARALAFSLTFVAKGMPDTLTVIHKWYQQVNPGKYLHAGRV